jgi:hypothetical protein
MGRGSTSGHAGLTKSSHRANMRPSVPKSGTRKHRIARNRPATRARVRIVRSSPTRARRSRPLPLPESINERLFLGSLERSLRDYRNVWEALAKR